MRIAYRQQGSGPPLVLVHGLGAPSEEIWHEIEDELARSFEVVAYDGRGAGRSDIPPGPYSLDDLAGDLDALLRALGLEAVSMLGHSLGGAVALRHAAMHPGRIAAIVGVGTPVVLSDGGAVVAARAEQAEAEGMQGIAETVTRHALTRSFQRSRPEDTRRFRELIAANDPAGYAANCRALVGLDLTPDLPRIAARVLLVSGDEDVVVPHLANTDYAAALPDGSTHTLADCGHIPPLEQPLALVEAVRSFL